MANEDPVMADLTRLRARWNENRGRLRQILARFDPQGLTRPARDPAEREWLGARDNEPFVEDEQAARAAREYYTRRYCR